MKSPSKKANAGFTLIELSVVIGIIAILAAAAIVAINPARQFQQARNSQRLGNVNAVLNAIGQRIADNRGTFAGRPQGTTQDCPPMAAGTEYEIYDGATGGAANGLDLSCLVPTYIPSFPTDPQAVAGGTDTGYSLSLNDNGRITVRAPLAELGQAIAVER